MKWIKFISSLVISYVLGFTLSKGLSTTNIVESSATEVILNYNLPFIYTVRLNEIAIIISLTIVGFFIVSFYYEKSESSLEEIFKIMIKVLWSEFFLFSFIIGTWTDNLLKKLEKDSFCYIYDWNIYLFLVSVMIFLYICFNQNRIKNKFNVKKESDLYSSRKILLPIIDEYLETLESLSIIGEWGIGKSKLIENFFNTEKDKNGKKYSDKYESIIIDTSSYSENKKIVNVIQNELTRIFKKYRILKLNINFVEKVFVDNNDFFRSIKNIFFHKESLIESKEELNEKVKELYINKGKRIILCLDNLERLNNVDRIKSLLSIIDDLLGEEIKKIYLYDKKHMIEIFNSEESLVFQNYMNKYSGIELKLKKIELKEVSGIEKIVIFIKNTEEKIKKRIEYYEKKIETYKNSTIGILESIRENRENSREKNLETEKQDLEKALEDIREKLSNPRYLLYLNSFIQNSEIKYDEEIKFEYRILIDIFKDYTFDSKLTKEIFINEKIYDGRKKKIEFRLLYNGNYGDHENIEEKKINELKEEAISENDGKKLLEKIDFLKINKRDEMIKIIFQKKSEKQERFNVTSYLLLQSFIELFLKNNIQLDSMDIILEKEFFSTEYSEEKTKNLIKILLILNFFSEVKMFIEYLYNLKIFEIKESLQKDLKKFTNEVLIKFNINIEKIYEEIYEEINGGVKSLSEKDLEQGLKELIAPNLIEVIREFISLDIGKYESKYIKKYNFDLTKFLKEIEQEFKKLSETHMIFDYINKEKLKKELDFLLKIKFSKKVEEPSEKHNVNRVKKNIIEFCEWQFKNGLPSEERLKEENERILIELYEENEPLQINEGNIDQYINILKEIDNKIIVPLLFRIFLLEERLKKLNKI